MGKKLYKVNLKSSNFFGSDLIKLNKAVGYVEEYFNSERMKDFILQKIFTSTEYTSEGIYLKIMSGSEVLTPESDNEADIAIEKDDSWTRNVIGYTYPTTMWQWIYAKFFNWWSAEEIAGNIAHEYMHKLGFDHYSATDYDSVPYAIGYDCEAYAKSVGKKSYFERFKAYFS